MIQNERKISDIYDAVMLGDSNEYYVNNVSVICLHGEQDSFVYSDKSNQDC